MSSDIPLVTLEGVTKTFQVDEADRSARWHGLGRRHASTFVAVDDVSFAVRRGEIVGLVGANGAGKSTALKMISRVMFPDRGRIILGGPIMSLLEVGAGFHPELTARENVYLNGAMLGLDRKEVGKRFDAIVSLAGVEQFLETPVKRFSSGMRVRLAVAVALHLDTDAIVLDEVLAVGDAVFQRRCLEILDEMASSGRRATLVVSHNMQTIHQLCRRVLVMQKGRLVFDGDPDQAIAEYFSQVAGGRPAEGVVLGARTNPHGDGRLLITSARLCDQHGVALAPVVGGPFGVEVKLKLADQPSVALGLRLTSRDGRLIAGADQTIEAADASDRSEHPATCRWALPLLPLAPGQYSLTIAVTAPDGSLLDIADGVITFTVTDPSKPTGALAVGLATPHVVLNGEWAISSDNGDAAMTRSWP